MQRPRISTNLAISADGKISSSPPRPSGWTSAADHARLLELRAKADAILIGRGTLEADRMTMTVPGKLTQPLRCIVSQRGEVNPAHPLFSKPGGKIHLLVTGSGGAVSTLPDSVIIHRKSLAEFLQILACEHQVRQLHCEGGGQLIRALAELDAIDEFHLTLAGYQMFGGLQAVTATGIPGGFLPSSLKFRLTHFDPQSLTGECFLTYTRQR